MNLAHNTDKWWPVVDMVTNFCCSIKYGEFLEYWPLKNIMQYFLFTYRYDLDYGIVVCDSV